MRNVTPSDFALMVKGIPKDKTLKQVAEWFRGVYPNLEVIYVNFCYNLEELLSEEKNLTNLKNK